MPPDRLAEFFQDSVDTDVLDGDNWQELEDDAEDLPGLEQGDGPDLDSERGSGSVSEAEEYSESWMRDITRESVALELGVDAAELEFVDQYCIFRAQRIEKLTAEEQVKEDTNASRESSVSYNEERIRNERAVQQAFLSENPGEAFVLPSDTVIEDGFAITHVTVAISDLEGYVSYFNVSSRVELDPSLNEDSEEAALDAVEPEDGELGEGAETLPSILDQEPQHAEAVSSIQAVEAEQVLFVESQDQETEIGEKNNLPTIERDAEPADSHAPEEALPNEAILELIPEALATAQEMEVSTSELSRAEPVLEEPQYLKTGIEMTFIQNEEIAAGDSIRIEEKSTESVPAEEVPMAAQAEIPEMQSSSLISESAPVISEALPAVATAETHLESKGIEIRFEIEQPKIFESQAEEALVIETKGGVSESHAEAEDFLRSELSAESPTKEIIQEAEEQVENVSEEPGTKQVEISQDPIAEALEALFGEEIVRQETDMSETISERGVRPEYAEVPDLGQEKRQESLVTETTPEILSFSGYRSSSQVVGAAANDSNEGPNEQVSTHRETERLAA